VSSDQSDISITSHMSTAPVGQFATTSAKQRLQSIIVQHRTAVKRREAARLHWSETAHVARSPARILGNANVWFRALNLTSRGTAGGLRSEVQHLIA